MKVVSYKILEDKSQHELQEEVNGMLKFGWQPFGGVTYIISGMVSKWAQAMVKYE